MRACSTVTLLVLPLHITITQTRPHLRSALCRSTQFATSINNVVSQRGLRSASCIVDVDWLKVWVQLVVRGEMETTEMQQMVYYMDLNEHLNVATFIALDGSGPGLVIPTSSLERRLTLQKVEQRRRVFSLQYMYRITLQNVLLSNKYKYSFRHPQYCSYVTCNCQCNFHCLWTLSLCTKDNCSKNTKLQRTSARAPTHFTIKHKSVNSLQITSLLFYVSI